MFISAPSHAAEITVRLRFLYWTNSTQTKQHWTGQITIEGGAFSELQSLGVEADAPVALRAEGNRLIVDPLEKRSFDGCDVTVRADEQATVRIELRTDQVSQFTTVEVPLRQLAEQPLRKQLDELNGVLLVHRSPGDKLRVVLTPDNLVFKPSEVWNLGLEPDLIEELAEGPVQLDIRLHRIGSNKVLWQTGRQIDSDSPEKGPLKFEIICPDQEDAYRLSITARHLEGLATRFLPGQQAKLLANREVEFVVVDPAAKQPVLADHWQPVLSIDPANPSWWQRLPSWARVPRLRVGTSGTVGNVQPVVRSGKTGDLVELPPAPKDNDPYWQSYTLPVRETGQPHVVELQFPTDLEQHLAISVIEPDASGRVTSSERDAGFYTKGKRTASDGGIGIHRFVFWPRTRSPQLLIVNRHPTKPAQYGKISLLRHDDKAAAPKELETSRSNARLVACYLSQPIFADCLGAAELLDPESGRSVQTWSTFLNGANRLAQHLRLSGYNAIVLSVAADGGALYPSKSLNPSPRYDTGMLASSGQDPVRKDVLELLLRVFDREGLRIVPMVQLAAPLPRLEQVRRNSKAQTEGIAWVGSEGKTWLEENPTIDGRAPYYNVLDDRVQAQIGKLVSDLSGRYSNHPSFAGVGLKISGEGYGLLPGLAWGMDDTTIAAFSREIGVDFPFQGPERFHRRAEQLLGTNRQQWQAWRSQKLTQMYAKIAAELIAKRSDLQLILATEDVFAGATLQQRVRKTISKPESLSQVLLDHGLDFEQLDRAPGVVALAPLRLGASDRFQQRALDLRINAATDQGKLLPLAERSALLFHHAAQQVRLASFDKKSPFGSDHTHLTLAYQPLPAGALQQRYLAGALAQGDAQIIVEGGQFLSFGSQAQSRNLLKTLQQLPGPEAQVHTLAEQPLVMRVYRSANSTTVVLINEAPWPISVQLPLSSSDQCVWRKLDDANKGLSNSPTDLSGTLARGDQDWFLELKPSDLQAWKFDSTQLRLGHPQVSLDAIARQDLQQRIEEIESRTGNLNIRRPYLRLENSGFELANVGDQIVGWQPRLGLNGSIDIVSEGARTGARALRFQSQRSAGVAIQSDLFPMPETGQLMLSGYVRGLKVSPEAQLRIVLEDSDYNSKKGGRAYRQYAILGGKQAISSEWSKFEFPVDDIPFGTKGQLRVQFDLTGEAELLLDDIELVDLRFDKLDRGALVKGIYAAKTALADDQVIDCLHLVDQYWSQYLVEYVPPVETRPVREAKQPPREETSDAEKSSPGFTDRLRGFVPKRWR